MKRWLQRDSMQRRIAALAPPPIAARLVRLRRDRAQLVELRRAVVEALRAYSS